MHTNPHTSRAWKTLRYSYGIVIVLAGLDKLFGTNIIVFWPKYISPLVASTIATNATAFLIVMGIIEVIVGILAFTRFTMLSSYISAVWLILITINLLLVGGYLDIAIRDLLLALGAFAAGQLAAAHGYTLTQRPA
ncbi:MAG TPA: hypothetical protein VF803_00700 [Candidatus Paceibacterota bacterium]